ncbi:MAG: DUF3422 domain-containing protein, partial [Burkholderiales bacterium]|nr:DUF3422 domain-containing protein [Burkholderiales bacterium]
MSLLPADHPQRLALADEVHARPPLALRAPARASHLAVLVDPGERAAEREHLAQLCHALGRALPAADADQVMLESGDLQIKWERHGEFSGYTVVAGAGSIEANAAIGAADASGANGSGDHQRLGSGAFAPTALSRLPAGWLEAVPGATVVAAHALV